MTPRAAILMREVPEGVGDRRRFQEIFVLCIAKQFSEQRHVDAAIDIDVCDVDSLGMKIARHHLRKPRNRKLGRREGRGGRPRPHTRCCAGNQNRTAPALEHLRDYLSRPQKCPEGVEAPGLLEYLGRRLHQPADRAPPTIEDQNLDWAELAVNPLMCGCDMRLDGRIALDRKCDATHRSNLVSSLFDNFTTACDQRNFIIGRETAGESCAQTGSDAYDYR